MDGPADKTAKPAPPPSWQKYRNIISQRYHEELDHHIFYRSHQRILRGIATPYELGIAGVYIWFCAQFPARAPIYGIGLAAILVALLIDAYEVVKLSSRIRTRAHRLQTRKYRVNPVATIFDVVALVVGVVSYVYIVRTDWRTKELHLPWRQRPETEAAEVVPILLLVDFCIHGFFVLLALVASCFLARHPRGRKQESRKETSTELGHLEGQV